MKNKSYIKSIILGFSALYLVSALFATHLTKCSFEKEFADQVELTAQNFINGTKNHALWISENDPNGNHLINFLNWKLTTIYTHPEYQQLSAAIYNNNRYKIAQSANVINQYRLYVDFEDENNIFNDYSYLYFSYPLQDYFSEKEILQIAEYYREANEAVTADRPSPYMFHMNVRQDTMKVDYISFNENSTHSSLLKYESSERITEFASTESLENTYHSLSSALPYNVTFPYMFKSYKEWKRWQNDEYLQNFPDFVENLSDDTFQYDFSLADAGYDWNYTLAIRQTTHPWLAAMDDLIYIYLGGFIIMLACMLKVIYSTNSVYKQRAALEETRRDFTNAIAHELKTPLGVIRGFAENTLEGTVREKQDYYQQQIIKQTEVVDQLVKEMICISKLDSEQLVLRKEPLTLRTIIEEQLSTLEHLSDEKNLEIRYDIKSDFNFKGDKQYFEKAIWNLLENAIEYNHLDGTILISINNNQCTIENTGKQIAAEDLPHLFDLFYTSDKSRTSGEKHMGLGLYLAKKILNLHNLNLTIENISNGVKATISR